MSIEPYYRSADGAITVYCARWEDVHAAGLLPVEEIALVHGDPPYGNDEHAHRPGQVDGRRRRGALPRCGKHAKARAWPALHGNDRPHDPSAVLAFARPTVLWGANHYASRLPDATGWLFWDKRDGTASDDGSDGELAWTNLGGALRIFRHVWRGLCRASESGGGGGSGKGSPRHLHPTQKPIALSVWVFQRAKLRPGDLVFVPYLGSGPDLAAAVAMGIKIIACDVEEWCCRAAVSARLKAAPHVEPSASLGPLFDVR